MQQARYFCSGSVSPSDYHHYGLAAPIYTHFTSPIRRYSDQMVHRLLAAVIRWEAVAADSRDRTLKRPPLWQVPQLASRALAALGSSATPPPPPPGERQAHCAPNQCLGCASEPSAEPPIPLALPPPRLDATAMGELVDNLNLRHTMAQHAGRASVGLHTLIFFKNRDEEEDAYVIKVRG